MSTLDETVNDAIETVEIENVVAASDLGVDLDLEPLSLDLTGAQYDPDAFPGVVYRSPELGVTTLIFRSGKVVTTGGKSVEQTEKAVDELVSELEDLGIEHDDVSPVIQNVVGSADLDKSLNLNAIAIGLGLEQVEYEPEQFPGLIYRAGEAPCVALLFGSGKVVLTGGKEIDDISLSLEHVMDQLDDLSLL